MIKRKRFSISGRCASGQQRCQGCPRGQYKVGHNAQGQGLGGHPDKTSFIVCRSQRFKQKAKDDLQSNNSKLGDCAVKECVFDKYLGQVLQCGGLDDSALAIVREMVAKIKGDINHNLRV